LRPRIVELPLLHRTGPPHGRLDKLQDCRRNGVDGEPPNPRVLPEKNIGARAELDRNGGVEKADSALRSRDR
jgi:hypothetical protein